MRVSVWRTGLLFSIISCAVVPAQSINSGTVTGTVADPSGGVIVAAAVELRQSVTGFHQRQLTDANGAFRFNGVPHNNYQLAVAAPGFSPQSHPVHVRGAIPLNLALVLQIPGGSTSVDVESSTGNVEADPSAHQDVDRDAFLKLPSLDPGGSLSQAITYSTGAVAADANGFFHPLGDHAQTTIVIDGQPDSDQQSKLFSTQIPANALQSMELISGSPDAQYGDKSSLIVNATTRSGLGAKKAFGDLQSNWGSFGTWGGSADLGFGSEKMGDFLNGVRSGHFLDTPERTPIHDTGNNGSIFDRFDWQASPADIFHLNLFSARNWFQVPNSYDQLAQDQRQRVLSWNIAPGYQHVFNAKTLLTVNPFIRRDVLDYFPSGAPFNDTPVTASQSRSLMNYGIKADIAHQHGRHDLKLGLQIQQTRLHEQFQFGVTDPVFNAVCLDANGNALTSTAVSDPAQCSSLNAAYTANPGFQPGLLPYDLTRGGALFSFDRGKNVNQYAFYATDFFKVGKLNVNAGLRVDQYNGLVSAHGLQPRIGLSYMLSHTHTLLRAAYARTFETPFNENLILSSGTGSGGLAVNVFGSVSQPIKPGNRDQFNAGLQQGLGKWLVFDGDAFWKFTDNAYDFSVLFNTPITFPVSWGKSKLDGVTARLSSVDIHGFQAYFNLGHTRARYFPPEVGGLIPLGGFPDSVFRIDHDQAYQHNLVLRYQRPKRAEFIDFTWRYDSGLVVSGVPDAAAAMELTPNQQVTIGLACNGVAATAEVPITSCGGMVTSKLLALPQTGEENDDHNPARVKPRSLFNVGFGTDNLLRHESGPRITLRFAVENLTNKPALYNFLSTFSGTHFVPPRTFIASLGYSF